MNFDSPWVIALLVIATIAFLHWLWWGAIDRYRMRCAIREIMRHQSRKSGYGHHTPDKKE